MRAALEAPWPATTTVRLPGGATQWLLEGPGWALLRPAVDLAASLVAAVIAVGGLRAALHLDRANAPVLLLPLVVVAVLYLRGLYRPRMRNLALDSLFPVAGAVSIATLAVAAVALLANGELTAQPVWMRAWLLTIAGVAAAHALVGFAQHRARALGLVAKPVVIVGAGMVGTQVARRLGSRPEYGLTPVGFLDDDPRSTAEVGERVVPVIGRVEEIDAVARHTGVRHLIVAFSSVDDARLSGLVQRCQALGVEVSIVPRMFDTINHRMRYETLGGLPVLGLSRVDPRGAQFALKHAMDRVIAAGLLLALAPVLVVLALAVRLSSPGPALFRQRRVGRDGKVFDLYKLRTMRVASDRPRADFRPSSGVAPGGVEGIDRRTPVGRFLRRSSLDELPQLFNVLRGDMSLIGPRPERPEFVELFGRDIARYGDRHRVKSGITGWAQVHGLRGQTSLADRVEWDNYYISHWSLGLDVKIMVLTLVSLFRSAE